MFIGKKIIKVHYLGNRKVNEFKNSPEFLRATNVVETTIMNNGKECPRITAELVYYRNIDYGDLVNLLVREQYTVAQELAVLRQRDTKPEEFEAYNLFAEDCKIRANAFIDERTAFEETLIGSGL